ncbi:MAG: hypothetical protein ABL882_01780 [Sphingopyxis sp.]
MNAPTSIGMSFTMDEAHILRSKLIERFAQFETLLFQVIAAAGIPASVKSPMGQRIDAINSALAAKDKLNKHDKRLSDILDKAGPAMALRNELAHGTMVLAKIDNLSVLLVKNANSATQLVDSRVVVRQSDFDTTLSLLANLTNQLKQVLTPPSPPRPAPGAAAGP